MQPQQAAQQQALAGAVNKPPPSYAQQQRRPTVPPLAQSGTAVQNTVFLQSNPRQQQPDTARPAQQAQQPEPAIALGAEQSLLQQEAQGVALPLQQ